MCGIIGIASLGYSIQDKTWLEKSRDTMEHRGPDNAGEWWSEDDKVGLGHRRLSIIDLTSAGHQPMHDVSNNFIIAFNGEIYNYCDLRNTLKDLGFNFRTSTDTEVILNGYKAWGAEVLNKLNGMFAFSIYDIKKNTIFIARDRAGEKPIYYQLKNKIFTFSSELKGLLVNQDNYINYESFDCFLTMGFAQGSQSLVNGINKLPPAHYLQLDLNSEALKITRYWDIPEFNNLNVNEDELLYEFEELLYDSVKKQMVADVSLGVLLSGGLDSSLITAMAARSSNNINTFTVRFPGYSKFDETNHARLISDYFNTNHVELDVNDLTTEVLPILRTLLIRVFRHFPHAI